MGLGLLPGLHGDVDAGGGGDGGGDAGAGRGEDMDVRTKTMGRDGLRWTVGSALTWPGPTHVQLEKVEVLVAVALRSRANQRSG